VEEKAQRALGSDSQFGHEAALRRSSTRIVALEYYIRLLDDGCQPETADIDGIGL